MSAQPISGHKGRDGWMCALAAASDLSTMAIRLALRLCVSFNCKTGQCDPGYRTLAEDMAVSERSVFRAIAELEAGGWIAVDRTGGDNTRNNQFALLIPSAQVTTVVTRSGDNMVSPENVSVQVTENGGSGDKNRGVQVTHSVSPLKNLKPENLNSSAVPAERAADADSQSAITNSATVDDETPNQRAPDVALNDHLAPQNQPSPERDATELGTGANGANAAAFDAMRRAQFEDVRRIWPRVRIDEGEAFAAFLRAMAGRRLSDVIEAVNLTLVTGGDVPWLSEALTLVERNLAITTQPTRTGG